MDSFSAYAAWFLGETGVMLGIGFFLSFLISPVVIRSDVMRALGALILSILLIALLGPGRPVMSGAGHALPWAALAAFGLAFTVAWLRHTRGRRGIGWVCLAIYLFILAGIVREF